MNISNNFTNNKPQYFYNLAHWAKQQGKLTPWERSLIFNIGVYISRGWKISEKQTIQAIQIIQTAIDAGFQGQIGKIPINNESDTDIMKEEVHSDSNVLNIDALNLNDIKTLELSIRSYNALTRSGIQNTEQLKALSDEQLLKIRNLGIKSLKEIREAQNLPGLIDSPVLPETTPFTPLIEPSLATLLDKQKAPLDKIGLNILNLRVRAFHVLKDNNIMTLEQLLNRSQESLANLKNLGNYTQSEIIGKLNSYLLTRTTKNDWQTQVIDIMPSIHQLVDLTKSLCSIFEKEDISNNLALPEVIKNAIYRITNRSVDTLTDLKIFADNNYFCTNSILTPEIGEDYLYSIKQIIDWFNKALSYKNVDDEINGMLQNVSDRERYILIHRIGTEKHLTLEKIGNQLKITRERVRQIEKKAKRKFYHRIARLPILYSISAVSLLNQSGEKTDLLSWKQNLINLDYLNDQSYADMLLAIAKNANISQLVLSEGTKELLNTGVSQHIRIAKKSVLPLIKRFSRISGVIRPESFVNNELSEDDIEKILSLEGFKEIEPGWWFNANLSYVPMRIARKVISYCGSVSPQLMRYALRKYLSRFKMPTPPSDILAIILQKTGEFILENGLLRYSAEAIEHPSITGPEKVFLNAFHTSGPILSFHIIHDELIKEGFSTASVANLFSVSPLIRKVAAGLYTLNGTQYDLLDIQQAKALVKKVQPNHSMELHSNGVVEFRTTVGNWLSYGGVLNTGPVSSLTGDWNIVSEKGSHGKIVIGKQFIYGLSIAAKNLGIIPGDRIRLNFNTWTRQVYIEKVENYD